MAPLPPIFTSTAPLFPYTALFRSGAGAGVRGVARRTSGSVVAADIQSVPGAYRLAVRCGRFSCGLARRRLAESRLVRADLRHWLMAFPARGSGLRRCEKLGCRRFVELGRASCREGECQYGWVSVVAVSLKPATLCIRQDL